MDTSESIRRTESWLERAGGPPLFRRSWLPREPRRALLLVHGFAEHCGRYDEMACWFAARGFAVHGYDQRGHGKTPGIRGHAPGFGALLDDLEQMIACVRGETAGLPLVLTGHSMGGLVVAAMATSRTPDVSAITLSGPALAVSDELSGFKQTAARILARFLPRLTMNAGLDSNAISRDPEVVRRYDEDPLVDGRMSTQLAADMMSTVAETAAAGARVTRPMLIQHGGADRLCPASGSEAFFATLPVDRLPGCALRVYPGLYHEIFNEPEREQVWTDLLDWIDEREARGELVAEVSPEVGAAGGVDAA